MESSQNPVRFGTGEIPLAPSVEQNSGVVCDCNLFVDTSFSFATLDILVRFGTGEILRCPLGGVQ